MISVLAGLAAGAVLGLACFGGLWLTLAGLGRAGRPRGLLGLSFLVRLVTAAAGFGLLAAWGHLPATAGLAGLLGVRQALLRRLGAGPAGAAASASRDEPARGASPSRRER